MKLDQQSLSAALAMASCWICPNCGKGANLCSGWCAKHEMVWHKCPHCDFYNKTIGDIGAAICSHCSKGSRTKEFLTLSDLEKED